MSSRPAILDISALSPAEWQSYSSWAALIDLEGKMTPDRMLSLVQRAVGKKTYDPARGEEILAVLEPSPTVRTTGSFLAILRLVAHSRINSVLCRDHVFIQTAPLRLTPASLSPDEPIIEAFSNPFRTSLQSQTIHEEESNPYRRVVSGQARPMGENGTPALSNATSSLASHTPSTAQAPPAIPPLPPRPIKHHAHTVPVPPPRNSVIPPPRESSRSMAGGSSFEVIATSVIAPSPRRPRISPSALLGSTSTSYFGEHKMPPVLPKPKMVSSTHIGPSTRMRPVSPANASLSDGGGGLVAMEREPSSSSRMEREHSTGSRIQRAPSLSSTSSSSSDDGETDAAPPAPLRASLVRAQSLVERPQHASLPPPPKRRVSGHQSASVPPGTIGRSLSYKQPRSASMMAYSNSQNRPLDSFLPNTYRGPSDVAQEWIDKARRRATMPALALPPPDKRALMRDREAMGQVESDELDEDDDGDDDDVEPTSVISANAGWTRLE